MHTYVYQKLNLKMFKHLLSAPYNGGLEGSRFDSGDVRFDKVRSSVAVAVISTILAAGDQDYFVINLYKRSCTRLNIIKPKLFLPFGINNNYAVDRARTFKKNKKNIFFHLFCIRKSSKKRLSQDVSVQLHKYT